MIDGNLKKGLYYNKLFSKYIPFKNIFLTITVFIRDIHYDILVILWWLQSWKFVFGQVIMI